MQHKLRNMLHGAGSILQIMPAGEPAAARRLKAYRPPSAADSFARDWNAVGNDMRRAIHSCGYNDRNGGQRLTSRT